MNPRKENLKIAQQQVAVTSYLDYRAYLQRLYEKLKGLNDSYSYLLFAEDLGFSATNVMRLVMAGKRALSQKSALTIAKHLLLKQQDRRYFLLLVEYQGCKNAQKKDELFADLLALKQQSLGDELDGQRLEYFAEWYHNVIREMSALASFVGTPHWVASHIVPPISLQQAETSLELLTSIEQLAKDPASGHYTLQDEAPLIVPADKTANHLSLINYHRQMLRLAQESISRFEPSERELNALTLCLSQEGMAKLRDMIRKFCHDVLKLESEEQPREQVSQLNIQLFPFTVAQPSKVVAAKKAPSKGAKS